VTVLAPVSSVALASQKLQSSKLSDQLETLNSDVDLASLNLAVQGRASFQLLERVTQATIERTTQGASTLTITCRDYDRALVQSGYLGVGLDCEIDGLWFRLWGWSKSGDDLTLTFIDREVAVLKQWPPVSEGVKMYRVWPASKFGAKTRFYFAKQLIADVASILPIRFVCPAIGETVPVATAADQAANKAHGIPENNTVTVKGKKASAVQLANLEAVLETGDGLGANRDEMIAAVAVVTQESDALTSATNGPHVGLFQQDPADGWPATRDPATDATAFFQKAIDLYKFEPSAAAWVLAEAVQHSGDPTAYQQWISEATNTVANYLGDADPDDVASAIQAANAADPESGQFMRGRLDSPSAAARKHKEVVLVATAQGNKVVVREDNWACLTRLAQEIGYRCFCVSGTVYFIDDYTLFHQRVAMTLDEATVGVDSIDPNFVQGKENQTVTVSCRAERWACPPGAVAAIENLGPASGRWLCTDIQRSLFDPAATITLSKPVASIPESDAPEHGSGATSGTQIYTASGQIFKPSPNESTARQHIVAAALKAIALQTQSNKSRYHYLQQRPMPAALFATNPEYIDCSAFATLVYKAAGCPDPNGFGYDGTGNTGTLAGHAAFQRDPSQAQPGDLVFYGGTQIYPEHVAVYLGAGLIANMGTEGEPAQLSMDDPGLPQPMQFVLGYDLTAAA
jgi:cell wall-associated NlpC family hydrolase